MKIPFATLATTCVGLYCAGVTAQGKCDHYLDEECVDAYGSASFDFEPLFSEPPRFAYGFRVAYNEEVDPHLVGRPPGYEGDSNKVKTWLEYANETIHLDEKANRVSDFASLFTNVTGDISGGNNGCDGLLGKECVTNLKDILKWAIVNNDDTTDHIFTNSVRKFQDTPLNNLSCPAGIFDEFQEFNRALANFANEYEMSFSTLFGGDVTPPGNASNPWTDYRTYRSAEEQLAYAGVGIVARFPLSSPRAMDDIQLELICVRPEPVEGSGDRIDVNASPTGGTDNPAETDGAAGLPVRNSLLVSLIAIMAILLLL